MKLQVVAVAARTTPGRLGLMAAVLLTLALAFGAASTAGLVSRSDALGDLVTSSEPLAVAAQDIYRALSDADATAASAFLEGGVEPAEMRQRYQDDLAQAGSALAAAASVASTSEQASRSVAELSTYLPVYAGLVETARVNNRAGLPVGAAYLREASGLMRDRLLPAARQLYESETGRLAATEDRATPLPLVEVALGLVMLARLVTAQRFLRRRTNRVLNVGLVAATAASALLLLWVGVVAAAVSVNVGQARAAGSAQVQQLATARIAALEARAAETLTLVVRGSGQGYERRYQEVVERLAGAGGLLPRAHDSIEEPAVRELVRQAMEQQVAWQSAHQRIRQLDDSGSYDEAVDLAIGNTGAAPAFTALDRNLADAIGLSSRRFDGEVGAARSMLSWSVSVAVLLTVLAAASAVWGVWQRLKEYR